MRFLMRDSCVSRFKPKTEARPEVGLDSPVSIRIVVVFPAPFGPKKPNTSPGFTLKSISFTAVNGGKLFPLE
jgi:hypothetical protein